MLIDMRTGAKITKVPFAKEYEAFLSRMSDSELIEIKTELNEKIRGTDIQTAGWMPGRDWKGTVFQPIYNKAARGDSSAAARCFGLIVWQVFMERPEIWTSGRFENKGEPIGSRTYFQPNYVAPLAK
ncbi:hypothetical protein [Devosia sp. A449]